MTDTPHLGLPFIEGSQAQKHVTHNEALRILDSVVQIGVLDTDRTAPPSSPAEGDRHIVASGATGAWAGHADAVAVREDGAWRFLNPKAGWCAWSDADGLLLVYDGTAWIEVTGSGGMSGSVSLLGINDSASAPNLLTVKSNAALFDAIAVADSGSGDMRLQISKETAANTASVVFSDAFSGRAEFGLIGSDDFKLKVSSDGSTFTEALIIDRSSGNAAFPRGVALTGVISPSQITSNQNDYNPAGVAAASVINLSSDALRTISGLAGGAEGRVVALLNTGSQPILLLNESGSSTAANRFTSGGDLALGAKQAVLLRYDGTAARWSALTRPSGRETLAANRTYYVRSDGSNGNDGLSNSSGGAFLTIQKAIDIIAGLDCSIFDISVAVGAGTYGPFVLKSLVGSGKVTITGDTATPANVVLASTAADGIGGSNVMGRYKVEGFKFTNATSGSHIKLFNTYLELGANDYGAAVTAHVWIEQNAYVEFTASYTISGGATRHLFATTGGIFVCSAKTVTITGTPAFSSAFVVGSRTGVFNLPGNTYSGSATGSRYIVSFNAVVDVGGGGVNYLPGNAAGSTVSGGQYA
ncbi:hypothetical protein CSIRO_2393 [Bradyrhizobiaceae bacterium SG-6C]|nr:hypothetical protein CSIRO_2393 [Bradyrhizobiaceae bacterium SG-6C]